MLLPQHLSVSEIHMNAAGQARVEASDSSHDIDSFEVLRSIFFKNGSVLDRIFIRPRRAVDIARARVPRRRRIWMIIRNFLIADYDVMRQYSSNRFMESTANRLLRYFEIRPGFGSAIPHRVERFLDEIESRRGGIGLEVSSSAIALNRIAPFRDLPFELNFGSER